MTDRAAGRRCYASAPLQAGDEVRLGESEAHHLVHVLRVQAGAVVTLFDGSGAEFPAEVLEVRRGTVLVRAGAPQRPCRELPAPLHLAICLPKGDRQRWLVEKAVELGVATLTPLVTQRADRSSVRGADKLARYVVEASKQCGRNVLMEIAPPQTWPEWLAAPQSPAAMRWVAHPGSEPLGMTAAAAAGGGWLSVGPEGGLTDAEIEAARAAGWQLVDLGPRILRIETAAVVLAALAGVVLARAAPREAD
jgi:16S rRNA (uracil1498-N3)-methyltransferase